MSYGVGSALKLKKDKIKVYNYNIFGREHDMRLRKFLS